MVTHCPFFFLGSPTHDDRLTKRGKVRALVPPKISPPTKRPRRGVSLSLSLPRPSPLPAFLFNPETYASCSRRY